MTAVRSERGLDRVMNDSKIELVAAKGKLGRLDVEWMWWGCGRRRSILYLLVLGPSCLYREACGGHRGRSPADHSLDARMAM